MKTTKQKAKGTFNPYKTQTAMERSILAFFKANKKQVKRFKKNYSKHLQAIGC